MTSVGEMTVNCLNGFLSNFKYSADTDVDSGRLQTSVAASTSQRNFKKFGRNLGTPFNFYENFSNVNVPQPRIEEGRV